MKSILRIYEENNPKDFTEYSGFHELEKLLKSVGLGYERWDADKPLSENASPDEVIAAYKSSIDKLMHERGYVAVDVVALTPENPSAEEARKKFLAEHIHTEDEVRFFVDGSGMFYVHKEGKVFTMLCTKGDLISLPAGTTHWFDMGPRPFFKAIRLFNNPEGWVGKFTGSDIADKFPKYE